MKDQLLEQAKNTIAKKNGFNSGAENLSAIHRTLYSTGNMETFMNDVAIEYGRLKVIEALQKASEKAVFDNFSDTDPERKSQGNLINAHGWTYQINKDSILRSCD